MPKDDKPPDLVYKGRYEKWIDDLINSYENPENSLDKIEIAFNKLISDFDNQTIIEGLTEHYNFEIEIYRKKYKLNNYYKNKTKK